MGAKGINKGRQAERDVVNLIQPVVDHAYYQFGMDPPKMERRGLGLSGKDIEGLEWLSLEVKFHAKPHIDQWWEQCVEQAKPFNDVVPVPVLCYKSNFKPWRVRMWGNAGTEIAHPCIVDIDTQDFCWWLHNTITFKLNHLIAQKRHSR